MISSGPPPARRDRNAEATRVRIINAARQAFSGKGYRDVGVREIAALAECNLTLIRRYFGSKEALFEEVLRQALDVNGLIAGPRDAFGIRTVDHFLQDNPRSGHPMPILIFSTADPGARAIALRLLEERVVKPIATWLNQANGAELAGRISILCSGYFLYHSILPLAALTSSAESTGPSGGTKAWLARQLQAIVDEASPPALDPQHS